MTLLRALKSDFHCCFLRDSTQFCAISFWLRELLQLFVAAELIHWGQLGQQYEQVLRKGDEQNPPTSVFSFGKPKRRIAFDTKFTHWFMDSQSINWIQYRITRRSRYFEYSILQLIDLKIYIIRLRVLKKVFSHMYTEKS